MTVFEIHDFFVDYSNLQVPGVSADGQVEASQLQDGKQETENNSTGRELNKKLVVISTKFKFFLPLTRVVGSVAEYSLSSALSFVSSL